MGWKIQRKASWQNRFASFFFLCLINFFTVIFLFLPVLYSPHCSAFSTCSCFAKENLWAFFVIRRDFFYTFFFLLLLYACYHHNFFFLLMFFIYIFIYTIFCYFLLLFSFHYSTKIWYLEVKMEQKRIWIHLHVFLCYCFRYYQPRDELLLSYHQEKNEWKEVL